MFNSTIPPVSGAGTAGQVTPTPVAPANSDGSAAISSVPRAQETTLATPVAQTAPIIDRPAQAVVPPTQEAGTGRVEQAANNPNAIQPWQANLRAHIADQVTAVVKKVTECTEADGAERLVSLVESASTFYRWLGPSEKVAMVTQIAKPLSDALRSWCPPSELDLAQLRNLQDSLLEMSDGYGSTGHEVRLLIGDEINQFNASFGASMALKNAAAGLGGMSLEELIQHRSLVIRSAGRTAAPA
jgi:hypothetical protein